MILGGHVIISAYGFWLPNDQRGSWSDFIRKWELLAYGPASKVDTRDSVANRPYDRTIRKQAEAALKYRPVYFSGLQARAIARGFSICAGRSGCIIHACSIMPRHVHLVLKRHRYSMEQMTNLLKGRASSQLRAEGLHPLKETPYRDGTLPSPWGHRFWMVYIDDTEHFERAVKYVEDNPLKEGKQKQSWSFIAPYRG